MTNTSNHTLTATAWPYELSLDPKALMLLSLAEDAVPTDDPLIPSLSPLAAIHARDAYKTLRGAVAEGWLLRHVTAGADVLIRWADDAILAALFRLRSGNAPCAACVVRADSLEQVRSMAACPLGSHRQSRLVAA